MFMLFRYGLIPVVLFCVVVIAASIDSYSSNIVQKSTWPQTVVTVMDSQDFGDGLAAFRGTPNTFPDPHGTVRYAVDGKTYTWQGRGRDIGVTVMNPGDAITVYYDPAHPQTINTLVLLGASTGNIILAAALAFLGFYIWFFWLRGFLRRSAPPDDFDGDTMSFADGAPTRQPDQIERSRLALGAKRAPVTDDKPAARTLGRGSGTFGKR